MEHGFFIVWGALGNAKGVVELLMSLKGKFIRCPNVVIWSMIPHYHMWGLLGEECLDF